MLNHKPIETKYQVKFNFSAVESYSVFGRNSAFTEYQNLSDVDRNSIELVIENIFDKKGLSYQAVEQAEPDIKVTYPLSGSNSLRLQIKSKDCQIKLELSPVLRGCVFPATIGVHIRITRIRL